MKDKRTYTKSKEHGEDMSHENEIKIESGNLPYLIEMHKKEIWEWKKKESEWIKTAHQLANAKNLISELSARIVKAFTVIAELEKKLKEKQ